MRLSADLFEELKRCTRCGKCRAVCPVFALTVDETDVARGRIRLLEEVLAGGLERSSRLEEVLSRCLLCSRCWSVCPAAVRVNDLMAAARSELDGPGYAAWRDLLDRGGTRPGEWEQVAVRLWTGNHREGDETSQRRARDKWGGSPLEGTPRVGLFVGCLIDYLFPEVVEWVLEFCRRRGVGVELPREQTCCGAPAMALGAIGRAFESARYNAEVFAAAGVEAVVTLCPTCSRTLHSLWSDLGGAGLQPLRVLDLSRFALERDLEGCPQREGTVAYHEACSLRYGLGISEEPREILRRTARLVEAGEGGVCCGGGGLASTFQPKLARRLSEEAVRSLADGGAHTLVSTCPVCLLRLREANANSNGPFLEVVHLAFFLGEEGED